MIVKRMKARMERVAPSATTDLRDQFAMVALNGVLTAIPFETEFNIKKITLSCYKIADAMLEARHDKN
jgi:hypothetical protein